MFQYRETVAMLKVVFFMYLATLAHCRSLKKRQTVCPQVCDESRCAPQPESCYYGVVKDDCGCCTVCGAGEGDLCGDRGHGVCGDGLTCEHSTGKRKSRGVCVCSTTESVCGSDGRTYPSLCRLRAENRRAEVSGTPSVILIQKGPCEAGV